MVTFAVDGAAVGQRVDAWLNAHYPQLARTVIRKWLDEGGVSVNTGRKVRKGDRLATGEVYTVVREPVQVTLLPNPEVAYTVIAEDEALLVVSKPAGINCQPNASEETDTLANGLLARYPQLLGIGDSPLTCGILHRIDRETSGLVLVAKTQSGYEQLRAQFAAREVVKHYTALAQGELTKPAHLVNALAHNPRCPGRMIDATLWHDAKRPLHAETDYVPIKTYRIPGCSSIFTLLDVTILTGVTHQIRAQLSLAGAPLLGDKRYGGFQLAGFHRHFLHASQVAFTHPLTHKRVTYTAPLTQDLASLLP